MTTIQTPGIRKEAILAIWLEDQPSARSPYALYGNPPMWKTLDLANGYVLFSRPAKTMTRLEPLAPHVEVDGVAYQFQKDGDWVGQGCSTTFEKLAQDGAKLME